MYLQAQLQVDQLIDKTWKLQHISIAELDPYFNYLNNSEFDAITLQFNVLENDLRYASSVCATKSGTVNDQNSESEFGILFENGNITGQPCVDEDNYRFEQLYFNHIFDEEYSFTLSRNSNGDEILYISSPNMCDATFIAEPLSTPELFESTISLFPNPVSDLLTLKVNYNTPIDVVIKDVTGKLILKESVSSASKTINFSSFPNGVYFISFIKDLQILDTKRIIKK